MDKQPFVDIKVLDLTWYISGPYCTKLLADYGAEVIKVERPGQGDPARGIGPFLEDDPHPDKSLLFSHLNLNKKGVTLNLKSEIGRKIIKSLVKEADLLVENFSPGVLERLGLNYEILKEVNPGLVMTSISNFGQTGPYRDYKLSELVLNGFHAMIHNGEFGRYPVKKGGNVCQYQAGSIAAVAALGALWGSREQGTGQQVDVSLMETVAGDADRKSLDLVAWAFSGNVYHAQRTESQARLISNILPYGVFPCKDGFINSLPIVNHWPRFVELMKDPGLGERIRYPEDMFETEIKEEIDVMFYEWLLERNKREVMEECQAVKWFGTAVQTPKDVVEDPHYKERAYWEEAEHPVTGRQIYPGAPIKSEGAWKIRRPAPLLGQDNEEIFGQRLGYSVKDLKNLKDEQII